MLDLWRFFYYQYWLLLLAAFLFPNPVRSFQIVLGSLYMWAGFGKLVMPEFYSKLAPVTFPDVFNLLETIRKKFDIPVSRIDLIFNSFIAIGIFFETIMGFVLLFPTQFQDSIRIGTVMFNLSMHLYIICNIGVRLNSRFPPLFLIYSCAIEFKPLLLGMPCVPFSPSSCILTAFSTS